MISQLVSYALGTFVALFPVTNPVGAVPIFYSLTAGFSKRQRLEQAQKVALNASAIMAFFFVTGQAILDFWGISLGVLQIAGGLLIARTAWTFAETYQPQSVPNSSDQARPKDIALIPMAIPLISGPGAIGLVIGLAAQDSQWSNYLGGLLGIVLLGITIHKAESIESVWVSEWFRGSDVDTYLLGSTVFSSRRPKILAQFHLLL